MRDKSPGSHRDDGGGRADVSLGLAEVRETRSASPTRLPRKWVQVQTGPSLPSSSHPRLHAPTSSSPFYCSPVPMCPRPSRAHQRVPHLLLWVLQYWGQDSKHVTYQKESAPHRQGLDGAKAQVPPTLPTPASARAGPAGAFREHTAPRVPPPHSATCSYPTPAAPGTPPRVPTFMASASRAPSVGCPRTVFLLMTALLATQPAWRGFPTPLVRTGSWHPAGSREVRGESIACGVLSVGGGERGPAMGILPGMWARVGQMCWAYLTALS